VGVGTVPVPFPSQVTVKALPPASTEGVASVTLPADTMVRALARPRKPTRW